MAAVSSLDNNSTISEAGGLRKVMKEVHLMINELTQGGTPSIFGKRAKSSDFSVPTILLPENSSQITTPYE